MERHRSDRSDFQRDRSAESSHQSSRNSETPQRWEIKRLDENLPRQTRVLDCIRMKACSRPKRRQTTTRGEDH